MLSAAVISLALVAFAIVVRKEHLEARFKLTAANEKLAEVSLQDPLTGAWNRRFLDEHFGAIVARHAARGQTCALGVLDVDEFKELNDSYGHASNARSKGSGNAKKASPICPRCRASASAWRACRAKLQSR